MLEANYGNVGGERRRGLPRDRVNKNKVAGGRPFFFTHPSSLSIAVPAIYKGRWRIEGRVGAIGNKPLINGKISGLFGEY